MAARGIRITFDGEPGKQFKRSMSQHAEAVRIASREAAFQVAADITSQGRRDIASAGKFSSRWTDAFQVHLTEGGGNINIEVSMGGEPPMAYWRVFEEGRVIQGQPMLWIPLSWADDAKGTRARDYPGQLFRVDRHVGAPLLMTNTGAGAEAKYFGKEQVTIPKKFHLEEIVERNMRRLPDIYRRQFRQAQRGK